MVIGYTTEISSDFSGLCQTDVYIAQTNVIVMSTNISGIKVSRVSWDNFDILSGNDSDLEAGNMPTSSNMAHSKTLACFYNKINHDILFSRGSFYTK
jgi:hypothetical protein